MIPPNPSLDTDLGSHAALLGALSLPNRPIPAGSGCVGELPLQWLGGDPDRAVEAFAVDQAVETTTDSNLCLATSHGFAFGVIGLDETLGLATGTERAYRRLFDVLEQSDKPHLWRVWQYLPAINATDPHTGMERYRLFNQGRSAAFAAAGHNVADSAPAACALGCDDTERGRLIFLAADKASIPIENPRQVAAYHYPPAYGPRSPIFARAIVAGGISHDWLFISGTASITGHLTRHVDDIVAQTRETLANLEAVRQAANERMTGRSPQFDFDQHTLFRVYLRHPDHLAAVRDCMSAWLDEPAKIGFLKADICRSDLLVEIEATLRQPREADGAVDAVWALL
ncbi:hypothetical protein P8631_07165 [Guyparkeria sp. 1SP6A2]|nr:hypothetical protein [Guyparkeria sp. 1SP6A2]